MITAPRCLLSIFFICSLVLASCTPPAGEPDRSNRNAANLTGVQPARFNVARNAESELNAPTVLPEKIEPAADSPAPVLTPYSQWRLRDTVTDSLGRIGKPAVPALVRMLRHPVMERRIEAAEVLARIGPAAHEAVPGLIEALEDPEVAVRKAAARALGQIGPGAAEAVGPLLRVLEESETD